MALDKAELLQIDKAQADLYASNYITLMQTQIIARGNILNGAIQEYNKFAALPESSSIAGALFDAAFSILSTAVPLLKLADIIKKQHTAATVAIEITKAVGNKVKKGDVVVKALAAATLNTAKFVEKANDAKEVVGKVRELHTASQEVQTLCDHVARGPILELIVELNNAAAVWALAKGVVHANWILRLDDVKMPGTLEEQMKSLLPPIPKIFDRQELSEIWSLYLYLLVGEHLKKNAKLVTTVTTYYNDNGTQRFENGPEIEGVNSNQWKQIDNWFGRGARRGKIFWQPAFSDRIQFIRRFPPVQTAIEQKSVDNGSWRRAKM